jgi:hypothetical protein
VNKPKSRRAVLAAVGGGLIATVAPLPATSTHGRTRLWHHDLACWFEGFIPDVRQALTDVHSIWGNTAWLQLDYEDLRQIAHSGHSHPAKLLRAGCSLASENLVAAFEHAFCQATRQSVAIALKKVTGVLIVVTVHPESLDVQPLRHLIRGVQRHLSKEALLAYSVVDDERMPIESQRVSVVIAS